MYHRFAALHLLRRCRAAFIALQLAALRACATDIVHTGLLISCTLAFCFPFP